MVIKLEVFSHETPSQRLDYIPNRLSTQSLEEIDGVGGGSFVIHNDDDRIADPAILQDRNIVKVSVDGVVQSAFFIQQSEPTIVDKGEYSNTTTTISGAGLKDFLSDATVHPLNGVTIASYDNRTFNFAALRGTWYKPADWNTPVVISQWGEQPTNPWRYAPANWPDAPQANWIWSTLNPNPPSGFNFFRKEFNTTSYGKYSFFCAADDIYEVYIDGQLVTNASAGVENWSQTQRVDVDLPAGAHVIGVKVQNIAGRGGFIGTFYRAGDPLVQTPAVRLFDTDTTWTVCGYPDVQPGWTPGEVLIELLNEAKTRGVRFPNFMLPSFTDEVDSYGEPWKRDIDWTFRVGESYLSVVNKLQELACDVWIDPDTYEIHAATARGVDRADKNSAIVPIVLRKANNLEQARTKSESRIKNSLIVTTNGGMIEQKNDDSIVKYGVIEDALNVSADTDLSKIIANKVLGESTEPETGSTYKLIPREGSVPGVDFQIGDWVLAEGKDSKLERRRVSSISFSENKKNARVEYAVEFDTIFRGRQANLERWMTNTLAGSMSGTVSVASPTAPSGSVSDGPTSGGTLIKTPSTPAFTTIVSNGFGYWDAGGSPKAYMQFNWDKVITYTDGSSAVISRYEIWGYRSGSNPNTAALLGFSNTNFTEINGLDSGVTYIFFLIAVSNAGTYSLNSEIKSSTAAFPANSLKAPSTPTVTTSLGTATVLWDGLDNVGGTQPVQFRSAQVTYSTTETGTYARIGSAMNRGGGSVVLSELNIGMTYYFKVISIDSVGNISDPSAHVSITIVGVDLSELEESVTSIINSAEAAAAAAKAAADAAIILRVDEWAVNDSTTTPPTSGWSSDTPTWTADSYIWQRSVTTYGNGSTITGNPVLVTGNPGEDGTSGRGIASTAITYQAGTSGTSAPGGQWTSTIPVVPAEQFLWTRTVLTYTDATTTTSYAVSRVGENGAAGTSVSTLTSYFQLALTKPDEITGNPASPPSPWTTTEPAYVPGASTNLYTVLRTVMTNGGTSYSAVSLSASFTASKAAYDKAVFAQSTADGKNSIFLSILSAPPVGKEGGDLWYVRGSGPDSDKIIEVRMFNGSAWAPYQLVANSVLVPSSVGSTLIANGAVTTEKVAANAITANKIDFGSASGQAMFIGGRPAQGEAQQRIPSALTDTEYWGKVKNGEIALGTGAAWSSNILVSVNGLTIPLTGVSGAITRMIEVPLSRKVYVSYISETTNMLTIYWYSNTAPVSSNAVLSSGAMIDAPSNATHYYVGLRNPNSVTTYTNEDRGFNWMLNPSAEVNVTTWTPAETTLARSSAFAMFGTYSGEVGTTVVGNRGFYPHVNTVPVNVPNTSKLYSFSYYGRVNGVASATSYITTRPMIGGVARGQSISSNKTSTNTGFTRHDTLLAPPADVLDGYSVIIYSNFATTAIKHYVDGTMFAEVDESTVTVSATNTIPNPSAEVNTTGVGVQAATVARSTAWSSVGVASFQVTANGTSTDSCINQGDSGALRNGLTAGGTFKISGTIRLATPLTGTLGSRALSIVTHSKSDATGYIAKQVSAPNIAGEYQLSMYYTVPNAATEAFVRFYHGGLTGSVWWDDLRIQEVTGYTVPDYFDGDTVPVISGREFISSWTGAANASPSKLVERVANVEPARGGLISGATVFEVIGEPATERVEIIPSGVTAFGTGGKTIMSSKGLEVFNDSNQSLLRLGHNVPTGLEVRNPVTNDMIPLATAAFGQLSRSETSTHTTVAASGHGKWLWTAFGADTLSLTFTAWSKSVILNYGQTWATSVSGNYPVVIDYGLRPLLDGAVINAGNGAMIKNKGSVTLGSASVPVEDRTLSIDGQTSILTVPGREYKITLQFCVMPSPIGFTTTSILSNRYIAIVPVTE